jgi:hypothetical protein
MGFCRLRKNSYRPRFEKGTTSVVPISPIKSMGFIPTRKPAGSTDRSFLASLAGLTPIQVPLDQRLQMVRLMEGHQRIFN